MPTDQHQEGVEPTLPATPHTELDSQGAARRRFAKAGLGASGVLMTLTSQSAMACEICRSPSGYQSGKLTSQKVTNLQCIGRSPGYWKNCGASNYPSGYPAATPTTPVKNVLYCSSSVGGPGYAVRNKTLLQIVTGLGTTLDKNNVLMHLVAAYLNARKGWTSFLKPADVATMWKEYVTTGTYQVNATITWDGPKIVEYLTGTQD